jgi:putative ABC transport system permease protein
LIESTLTASISLLLSVGLAALLLPLFNQLSGKFFTVDVLWKPSTVYLLLLILFFVGLIGGSYPAFYLSQFNPVSVLKGSLSKSSGNLGLRKTLVVIQFSISMVMLICTYVVYGQLKYMKEKDLGFDRAQVASIRINSDGDTRSKVSAFVNQLRADPDVISVSASQSTPGGQGINFNLFSVESTNGYIDKGVDVYGVDEAFLKTLGISLASGRNFTSAADTLHSILVNESMVKTFGWTQPLGKRVKFPGDTSGAYLEVIGVTRDFHQKSLYNPINPLILFYRPHSNVVAVKMNPAAIERTLSGIENSWKSFFPELPFEYKFLDADFDSQYAADQKRGKIFTSFAVLTILITCLGLLGLIAFTTEQRQKELSVRKVMGAGIFQLVSLVVANFMLLVGISCLIAFPVAYYFMNKWLTIFPYNSGLQPSSFIWSALVVLTITLLTVLFHTLKASMANPSTNLRNE